MTLAELQTALKEPGQCRRCRESTVIPSHTWQGSLLLRCTRCDASEWIDLPKPHKKLVYLDNGVISNIASARQRGESDDPYTALADVLQEATAEQVVAVGHSPIARAEYEARTDPGFHCSREQDYRVGAVHLRHPLEIQDAQVLRSFTLSLDSGEVHPDLHINLEDAYRDDPHRWTDFVSIHLNWRTPAAWRADEAATIDEVHRGYLAVQQAYVRDALTVDEVERIELTSYGRAIHEAGLRAATRIAHGLVDGDDLVGAFDTTYSTLVQTAFARTQNWGWAHAAVHRFLRSEAPAACTYARLNARLLAHLLVGAPDRRLRRSDRNDVEQIAAYAPYFDVMVVDGFSAHLAGPASANINDIVLTRVISSGHDGIRTLIGMIEAWRTESPFGVVARRLHDIESARLAAAIESMRSRLEDDP